MNLLLMVEDICGFLWSKVVVLPLANSLRIEMSNAKLKVKFHMKKQFVCVEGVLVTCTTWALGSFGSGAGESDSSGRDTTRYIQIKSITLQNGGKASLVQLEVSKC